MSIVKSLKNLVTVLGGEPESKTVRGLLGEVAVALGGSDDGKTVAEQIDNIVAAKTEDDSVEEPVVTDPETP